MSRQRTISELATTIVEAIKDGSIGTLTAAVLDTTPPDAEPPPCITPPTRTTHSLTGRDVYVKHEHTAAKILYPINIVDYFAVRTIHDGQVHTYHCSKLELTMPGTGALISACAEAYREAP